MNQTLMTFDFYNVHVGLARYGNNNNIMNVKVQNKNTFLMMFSWQIWSYCARGAFENFKEAREGLETSHHQFAHMGLLYQIHNWNKN